jgi:hypothetical protein
MATSDNNTKARSTIGRGKGRDENGKKSKPFTPEPVVVLSITLIT